MIYLREYQTNIANETCVKLQTLGIVYLALQQRVGKTLTSLYAAELFNAKNVLFVTKKKAIPSILSDYELLSPSYSITVINYESVSKYDDNYDLAILDEAHAFSGSFPKPSKRFKDVKKIVYNIPCILMSATPSPESYSQLYHAFTVNKFHSWNKAKNFYEWAKYYVNVKKKYFYGREMNDYSDANIKSIQIKTHEYFINFTQDQAGFDRKIEEFILTCEMDKKTYDLIDILNRDLILNYNDQIILADTAVKLMNKVHQLSSGTIIDEEGNGIIIDDSKALFIEKYFHGKKISIFYKFKAEFELLKSVFTNWTDIPEKFQSGNFTFLGQFQSAREGVRLDTADALIFYNIDFSFLSYEQGKARILSKERTLLAPLYFIFSDKGIERKIYNVVKSKENYTTVHYKKDYGK